MLFPRWEEWRAKLTEGVLFLRREAWRAKLTEGVLIPQVYYDELLQGKTGRHDLKIQELKKK